MGSRRGRNRRARQKASVSPRVVVSRGRTTGGFTGSMAVSDSRPPPRSRASRTVSAWSSMVWATAAAAAPVSSTALNRALYRTVRAHASTDSPRAGDDPASRNRKATPNRSACRRAYAPSAADPGRSRWSKWKQTGSILSRRRSRTSE